MKFTKHHIPARLGSTLICLSESPAWASGSVVNVSLWDKGTSSMNMLGIVKAMGMAMMGSDLSMVTMGTTTDQQELPAGEVTLPHAS